MTFAPEILDLAKALQVACLPLGLRVATAESCTGGLVAAAITEIEGSSEIFDRGFVTYSNAAKIDLLGVARGIIETFGAVSNEAAVAMAEGALARSKADVAVAVTGIAGPGGGSTEKPVGLVHFGLATKGGPTSHERHLFPESTRSGIRGAAVRVALELLLRQVER